MISDKETTGETAKCLTHKGSICVNFAELIKPTTESIDQFNRLPAAVKEACRAHPSFQIRHFLHDVAKGRQIEAEAVLTAIPANTQLVLRTPGMLTDCSGRTFNCTAYEYAYWAKDTHMCRMLEAHMDEETKTQMLSRIDAIEDSGLSFQKSGAKYRSAHFDLTALRTALNAYIDSYVANDWGATEEAWMNIGKAQHDVPAHVAQEYCRPDRSFYPCPPFNESTLPRVLTFNNWATSRDESWFPLSSSNSGLNFNFGLIRGACTAARGGPGESGWLVASGALWAARDLAAITRLDEVRTEDLKRVLEHLNPPAMSHGMTM